MTKSKFGLLLSCIFLSANLLSILYLVNIKLNWFYFYVALVAIFILSFKWRYFCLGLVFLLAVIRVYDFKQTERYVQANFIYGNSYQFRGEIVDLDQKINGWQLVVKANDLENFKGKILVYAPLYPEYSLFDNLELSCKLFKPEPFTSELTGRDFAYDKYLAKDNIFAICPQPKLKKLNTSNIWWQQVSKSKQHFLNNLNIALPEPAAAFTKAIILDSRRELPTEINPSFSHTGLTHVISISGLHMVVIIWFWQTFLQLLGLKRQHIFWVLVLSLFLYLYLLNFISPALRSTAMILLVLLGPLIGRPAISGYSLLFLADILVLLNPYILAYDLGFQLSFSATLGLIFYTNWWQAKLAKVSNFLKIREVLAVTLAAQTFTWPLVMYYFGIFSIVAPVANFLVLPIFPPILILGILMAIFGGSLAYILSWPLLLLIKIMFYLVDYLGGLPYAYFIQTNFSLIFLVVSLLLMFLLTIIIKPYVKQTD